MEITYPADEASLRRELRQARARLEELVASLREVDAELDDLAAHRGRFDALAKASDALRELEASGGAALFWSGTTVAHPEDHLRVVRSRIDEFEKQLALVEERRQALLDEIEQQQDSADLFAGYILDAERLAEQQRAEWLIERELEGPAIRPSLMPWSRSQEDDRRFRRTLFVVVAVCAALGWLLPLVDIPIPERWEILEEQERLTQLVREQLPPPVAMVEPKPVDPVEPALPEETEAAPDEGEAAPELADTAQPESNPAPAARANTGTDSGPGRGAGSRGLLAFREQFAGVTATDDAVDRLGSNARIQDPTAIADGRPERSMVTSQAPGSSGGINVAALSRGTGGGTGTQLSGVAVTRATSTLGTGTGNGTGNGTGSGSGRGGSGKGTGSGASAGRTDEEIQIVFDRHKAALYRLYNRELRQDPTLRGQIVLRLTIQPDGSVSFCEVKSTDMKAPQLAAQVVERVKTFDFGAKPGIPAVTIVYPIDFLPAT